MVSLQRCRYFRHFSWSILRTGVTIVKSKAQRLLRQLTATSAGRERATDVVNPAVGIEALKKPGDAVTSGEALVRLHVGPASRVDEALARCLAAYSLGDEPGAVTPLVAERIA